MPILKIDFTVLSSTLALLLISGAFVVFIILFVRARQAAIRREEENKRRYLQQLSDTKTEVQNNTLGYISKELHDNVGQLLWVAKMCAGQLKKIVDNEQVQELDSILVQTANEVRHISHSLQAQSTQHFDLIKALQTEIQRIEKIGLIKFKTDLATYKQQLSADAEVIVFRMIQEFVANSLKHSEATLITLATSLQNAHLHISLADNGIGYTPEQATQGGNGLKNLESRAAMLKASLRTSSAPGKGTQLYLDIPLNQKIKP